MRYKNKLTAFALAFLLILSGCSTSAPDNIATSDGSTVSDSPPSSEEDSSISTEEEVPSDYTAFFTETTVHDLYVEIDENDWQAILDAPQAKEYYAADVTIDGATFENIGIRTKGNSSLWMRRQRSDRYPFKIKFDKYVDNQTFMELDELALNNSTDDPSYLRDYLGYEAFRQLGLNALYVTFFNLYVNDELRGLYIGVEIVDKSFLDRTFGNHSGNLYKAEQNATLAPGMDLAQMEQKKGDDESKSDLEELIRILDETETGEKGELETILDIDSVLKYFAGNAVIHNWDDYAGGFCHNYYLYMNNGVFHMLPWDMNESFLQTEAFYRESDGARQDITSPITGDVALRNRPLVEKVLAVPEYYERYLSYCESLTVWLEEVAENQLPALQERIQEAVREDPTALYSYSEFEQEYSESYSNGVAGFISERIDYLKERLNELLP